MLRAKASRIFIKVNSPDIYSKANILSKHTTDTQQGVCARQLHLGIDQCIYTSQTARIRTQ